MTHAEAREIVRRAWRRVHGRDPSARELAYAQAIASLETGYGRTDQFAAMAARGQYNWGALQRGAPDANGNCPSGTTLGSDAGRPRCFLVFDSDEAAAAEFIRLLTTRHWPVIPAMRGSPEDVARAMRVRPVYYEGLGGSEEDRINYYARAIRGAARAAGHDVERASITPGVPARSWLPIVVLGGAALGAWYLYYNREGIALRVRTERQLGKLLPL